MNNLVQRFDFSFLAASWLPQVVLVIVAIIVLNIGAYFLLRKIEKIALLSPSVWDDALIKATRKPDTNFVGDRCDLRHSNRALAPGYTRL